MEINITWNICRVCLLEETKDMQQTTSDEHPQMRNIFNDDKQLTKQIYECSGVTMKPNDSLPDKICRKCFLMVKHAANFRKTCRNSDAYLKSIIQKTKSASNLFKPDMHSSLDFLDETLISEEKPKSDHKENDSAGVKSSEEEQRFLRRKRKFSHSFQEDQCSKKDQMQIEIDIENAEDLIAQEEEEELTDNDINHMIKMEDILDNTENTDSDKGGTQDVEDESGLQDFEVQNNFSKLSSDESTDGVDENDEKHNYKHDSDELYYLLKDIKDESETDSKENQQALEVEINEESQEPVDSVEFMSEADEEQGQLHAASEMEDSQAQVSSTVETKEDFADLQNQSSNTADESNELATEYIVDEYLIDESDCNIKSRNSNIIVVNKKLSNLIVQPDKKRTQVILPNRNNRLVSRTKLSSSSAGNAPQIYICDLCGNHFGNRQLMNAHMKVHRQEKNHECELCLKRFITACNLQAHMRIHTGEKPFECQYCGRRFNDRSSQLRHERIHTNEKPYQCNECGKSFSLATTLKKHLKIHTGERLYKCEPCAKSFKLSHQLKAHISTSLHKAVIQLAQLNN